MRPARALIDLDALRHNYRLARQLGGGKALAVVKADAYGHGAVACARALQAEADGFAVACIEEALELRQAGIAAPILLLEGFFDADELPLIAEYRLWCAVASPWQVDAIAAYAAPQPLCLWLKLDSGMHRLGLAPALFCAAHARLSALPQVAQLVLMSHFACADELDSARTLEQAQVFRQASAGLAGETSLCNSPALLGWPQLRSDWGRPGLMLYGADPFAAAADLPGQLRPVMTLQSRIIAVRELAAGEPVGYGARFVAPRPTRVGVVAIGYADGYPQFAPNGTPVLIDGAPGELIGRVSMDMLTVDLTAHPRAGLGSEVQLWGAQPRIDTLAARCGSSAYRLLCGLKRAPRQYLGG
ncbi:alanine racemase [Xanthomonas theicola]|uniref:Alanine racemase n=1 Tax=Xanthomonas theicola TaxID=56464 RepID=A0A2S6ZBI2_9XANT|nr:alanine racemase [Xanthomonas theicola]PPT82070.1 alanine racemase [Xanthomonas theicola]QNH26626.1 alanine racemase [Xanthomonas theicola]